MDLKALESRLQDLIESRFMRILPGASQRQQTAINKIAIALQENIRIMDDGSRIAPNVYTLIIHPGAANLWQGAPLQTALLESLQVAAQEAGLSFATPPIITVAFDPSLSESDAKVTASHKVEPMADTKNEPIPTDGVEDNTMPDNAFLIIEGVKVFPLRMPVINIGRRLDNQLVIDDPRVSRNHSQLRAIKGRFVIFDLNSTGGTFVNGQRASQTVLYPGDVISLAGVALIFGQDNPPPRPDLAQTSPLTPATADRPTAIIKDRSTIEMLKKKE